MQNPRKLLNLDALRGVAILLVVGKHIPSPLTNPLVSLWMKIGWAGVDLFFVLSGFLVSGLIFDEFLKTGNFRLGRFFSRRALRIYPPLYFLLLVTVPLLLLNRDQRDHFMRAGLHDALFIQNYLPGTWGQLWSLAVEEHCYILLAGLLFTLAKLGKSADPFRLMPALFMGVFAVPCLAMRIVTQQAHPAFDLLTQLMPTHLRIDSLMFGVVLAYCSRFHRDSFAAFCARRGMLAAASGLLLAPLFIFELGDPWMHTWGFTCNYLGFGAVLCLAVTSKDWTPFRHFAAIGRYSYSIYLWLFPVAFLVGALPALSPVQSAAVYLPLSITVGVLAAAVIEAPSLRLREMLVPNRALQPRQVTTKTCDCRMVAGGCAATSV